ncbi:MAG: cell division topological specificity factor MinE [Clostridia bacterium]|nr:cell division topological specificity factor MinE [Clostridia bacterium]
MLGLLQRLLGQETQSSKKIAKERLRLVLVHDRADVSPHFFEALKNDLVEVISKYMEIDTRRLEVKLHNSPEAVALVANIPVLGMKRNYGS